MNIQTTKISTSKKCFLVLTVIAIIIGFSALSWTVANALTNFTYDTGQQALSAVSGEGLEISDNTYLYCDGQGNMVTSGSVTLANTNENDSIEIQKVEFLDSTGVYSGANYGTYTIADADNKISMAGALGSCVTTSKYIMAPAETITLNISYSSPFSGCGELVKTTNATGKFAGLQIDHAKCEAYAVVRSSSSNNDESTNDLLEFRYDGSRTSYSLTFDCVDTGTVSPGWAPYIGGTSGSASTNTVTQVNFTNEFNNNVAPKSCYKWFSGYSASVSPKITSFNNIDNLNTSGCTNMSYMFAFCGASLTDFNVVPDTSNWNTGAVSDMSYMFFGYGSESSNLNSVPDTSNWNTEAVTNMSTMFASYGYQSSDLISVPNTGSWNTGVVTNMSSMFYYYGYQSNNLNSAPDTSGWNTGAVSDMSYMFCRYGYYSGSLTVVPNTGSWNTGTVASMNYMFDEYGYYSSSLNTIPNTNSWDTGAVANMNSMFQYFAYSSTVLNSVPNTGGWNTGAVTDMSNIFSYYGHSSTALTNVPATSNWDTGAVTSMSYMFNEYGYSSTALNSAPDTSNWNMGAVTHIGHMFCGYGYSSTALTNVPDTSGWNTGAITSTGSAFSNYGNKSSVLTSVPDTSNWDTGAVTNMSNMFRSYGATSTGLDALDVSSWDISKVKNMSNMFCNCKGLSVIYCNNNWSESSVLSSSDGMFSSCSKLPHFDSSAIDKTYAYPDTGVSGYFTPKTPTYTLSKGDEHVTGFLDEDGNTITEISGSYGDKVKVKPVFEDGYTVDSITDNAGNTYTLDENGYFELELKVNGTITVTSKVAAEAYACWTAENSTLTFYYDGERAARVAAGASCYDMNSGYKTPGWSSVGGSCTNVVFDSTFAGYQPSTCYEWFKSFNNSAFSAIDLSNLDTSQVTNMDNMFYGCSSLTSLDVSGFNTENVENMYGMFSGCSGLTSLTLGDFDTSKVTDMNAMFGFCSSLTTLTLPNGFGSAANYVGYMFAECSALTTIYCSSDLSGATSYDSMFAFCSNLKGGNGTAYSSSYTGKTYARPDVPGQAGYFTVPFAVMETGDGTANSYPSGWTQFSESGATKYWKQYESGDVASAIAEWAGVSWTYNGTTYSAPIGGYSPATGTFVGKQTITAVWSLYHYQVAIWGIGQDRTEDSVQRISFGPATGETKDCLEVDGHEHHTSGHCIHEDSWQTIIDNINAGHADYYSECLDYGCTKSVDLAPNSTLFSYPTSDTYASILYSGINSSYRKWNNKYDSSSTDCNQANWAVSRMRATLNGYNNTWDPFTPSADWAGSDCLTASNCLLSSFPGVLQNNIKTKTYNVPTDWNTSTYAINDSASVSDKLWLPTYSEVYSTVSIPSYYDETSIGNTWQYAKKAVEGTTTTSYSKNKAYYEGGSAYSWWLRYPYRYYRYTVGFVGFSGGWGNGYVSGTNLGLSACFIL